MPHQHEMKDDICDIDDALDAELIDQAGARFLVSSHVGRNAPDVALARETPDLERIARATRRTVPVVREGLGDTHGG